MTREEIFSECLDKLNKSNFLLLELPTGFGKSKLSLDIVNHLAATKYKGRKISMLLLVAKNVHKQTWQEEIRKWGGVEVDTIVSECYPHFDPN